MVERIVFSANGVGTTEYLKWERLGTLYLTLYIKINSKWIKDLNVSTTTVKLLEENVGTNLSDLGLSNDFLEMTSKA